MRTIIEATHKNPESQKNVNKEALDNQANLSAQGAAMQQQKCCGEAARSTLRESIRRQMERAQQEASKYSALQELEYLLDKNPEVARILELMERVGR